MKWVTREHTKIDHIACPWLIRRFIESEAEFLYVPTAQVFTVAAETGAVPYDIPGAEPFAHDGELCPFDMIRCYMGADKVVGFGHQFIKALIPPPPEGPDSEAAQPGPRIMHPASAEPFQVLRTKMESEWTPQMMEALGIDAADLPIIWDADFLYGPRTASGEDTYVLCEINVSSGFAIPDQAPAAVARLATQRLRGVL
jgi:hypothetical protein